ncbi:MAG: beta-ketoacyl synthase N-terminal-like domain-containing protein [Planctomycetota bacterium]
MTPLSILSAAVLTPFGSDLELLLERLRAGPAPGDAPRRIPDADIDAAAGSAPSYRDRASSMLLGAARLSLAGFGIRPPVPDPERFGLVTGSHRGPLDSYALFHRKIQEAGPRLAPPLLFAHGYPNAPNTLASIALGIRGPNLSFSAGRVSGLSALMHGAIQIEQGRADRVLVAAFETVPAAWDNPAASASGASGFSEIAVAILLAPAGDGPRLLSVAESGGADAALALATAAAEAMLRSGAAGVGSILASLPSPPASAGAVRRFHLESFFGDAGGALGLLGVALAAASIRASRSGSILVASADAGGEAAAAVIG